MKIKQKLQREQVFVAITASIAAENGWTKNPESA
jgi:hypothetical protein